MLNEENKRGIFRLLLRAKHLIDGQKDEKS